LLGRKETNQEREHIKLDDGFQRNLRFSSFRTAYECRL
jgi:hypothetical protein